MIKQAEYIKSFVDIKDIPSDGFPHVLLLGRSNVGKSSLINAITNRKSLARVSATPGKTITLNMYLLNESMYLVDAPGYGYAKRSKTQAASFIKMIRNYVAKCPNLNKIFLLIDFKVGPTENDLETYQSLIKLPIKTIVIATKFDKVKSSDRMKQQNKIKNMLQPNQLIYFVSSETKYGINELIGEVLQHE
ncbi:MAG TPA: ribosome biogenesis GTP-binding protein YihA/YsxC [Acholeplasma sp.]|jgi:GTP-binding protein